MRRILAIYLAFATAAGPNLCCCATLELFARRAPTPPPPLKRAQKETSAKIPACCHGAGTAQTDDDLTRADDAAPKPSPRECPCSKQGKTPIVVAAEDTRDHVQPALDEWAAPGALLPRIRLPMAPTPQRFPH